MLRSTAWASHFRIGCRGIVLGPFFFVETFCDIGCSLRRRLLVWRRVSGLIRFRVRGGP